MVEFFPSGRLTILFPSFMFSQITAYTFIQTFMQRWTLCMWLCINCCNSQNIVAAIIEIRDEAAIFSKQHCGKSISVIYWHVIILHFFPRITSLFLTHKFPKEFTTNVSWNLFTFLSREIFKQITIFKCINFTSSYT